MIKMKRTLPVLLAGLICLTSAPLSASALSKDRYFVGDVDGNGIVNSNDLSQLRDFLDGKKTTKSWRQQQRLDVNLDCIYTQDDYNCLNNIISSRKNTDKPYDNRYGFSVVDSCDYYVYEGQRQNPSSKENSHKLIRKYSIDRPTYLTDYDKYAEERGIPERKNRTGKIVEESVYTGSDPLCGIANLYGSAFAIDEHTLLTAGHCVTNKHKYTGTDLDMAETFTLRNPRRGGAHTFKIKYAQIPANYIDPSELNQWKYDIALVVVEENLKDYLNPEDFFIPTMVSYSAASSNLTVHTAGWLGDSICESQGKFDVNILSNTLDVTAKAESGMSGSPVYISKGNTKYAVAVNSWGTYGPYFTQQIFSWVKNYVTPGDIDFNGKVDISDLSTLKDHLLGQKTRISSDARSQANADVNGDDVINGADIVALTNIIIHK